MRLNFLFKGVFFLLARIHWVQPSCLELSPLQATNSAVNLNCPFNPVMERMMNTSSVEKSSYQVALMKTLRELLLGPLQEKSVTLIVSGLAKKLLNMDKILSYSKTPFILFEDETNQDKKNIKYYEKTMEFFSTSDEYSKVLELIDPNVPERRADKGLVTVYITEEHSPAYLMSPFSTSKMTSLLILSLDSECDVEELLQTPIAKQTSSLAIFCPVFNKNEARSAMVVTYRVFTWLPFHPDHMMVSLGQWSLTSFPAWEDLFIDRFASLYGMTLHVSGDVEDRPFFFQHEDETFDGTSVRMMDALGKWMDFKYTLTENASDYQWGECENGSWVGMLGDIWREEKDMAINSLTITEKRARDFDYTFPHFIEGYGFAIQFPPPLPRWRNLIYPFDSIVWGAVAGALVIASLVFHFLPHNKKFTFLESSLIIAQSVIYQGVPYQPTSNYVRLFLLVWWLAAYIIVISYTCNLIAILTVPVYPKRIESVEQLAVSDYRICMLDYGDFVPEALATSADSQLLALGKKLDLVPLVSSLRYLGQENCMDKVFDTQYAQLEGYSYVQLLFLAMGYGKDVYFVKEQIYKANMAFFFKKNTPWKYKFDKGIMRLVESGLIHKWYDDIMAEFQKDSLQRTEETVGQPLSLAHLQGPFLLLVLGMLLALLIFLVEHIHH